MENDPSVLVVVLAREIELPACLKFTVAPLIGERPPLADPVTLPLKLEVDVFPVSAPLFVQETKSADSKTATAIGFNEKHFLIMRLFLEIFKVPLKGKPRERGKS